jgi:integrase
MREIIELMRNINQVHSYMFFNHRGGNQPYLQQNSLNNLITRLDGGRYKRKQTAHGFRAFMNTHGIDELGYEKDIIRRCLHHAVGNKVERAYNHAKYFGERRAFMNDWSSALVKKGL